MTSAVATSTVVPTPTTPWSSYESISELNDVAVSFLSNGQYASAVGVLQTAIKNLVSAVDAVEETSEDEQFVSSDLHLIPTRLDLEEIQPSDHTAFALYNCAFRFAVKSGQDYEASLDIISGVLFYNMGLACHALGLTCQANSRARLQRALGLYQVALKVESLKIGRTAGDLLRLALWNNQGQIHALGYDTDAVKHSLNSLHSALTKLQLPLHSCARDYESFNLNLLIYRSTGSEHTAGAA